MLTIDIDEWEWYDRFDHTMLNLLAVMLRHQSAEVERLTPHQNCGSHWDGCWRAGGHHSCAIAEVERLTWMLREVYGDWVDGESYESWLADLASRWEER